jgi:exonuclease SbcC
MTAFGPFTNTQSIDFTVLGENPLFLINGPTGAGKTTILDAICFALYGQTTGAEREGRQMRCDYAAPDVLTEVELVFELNNQQYHVHRTPEQFKPRSRNSEHTDHGVLHKPTANLHQVNGEKTQLLAAKVSEVTRTIEELTSLKVDQFRQVMVLPQGKFRQLLMADSKERETIFSQLFQTHHYKKIEDKLASLAKGVKEEAHRLRDNQSGVLQSVELDSTEGLEAELATQRPLAQEQQTQLATQQAKMENVSAEFQSLQQLGRQFDQLAQSLEQQLTLKDEEQSVQALKLELQQAQLAVKLLPTYAEQLRCGRELDTLLVEQQAGQTALHEKKGALDAVMQQVAHLPAYEQKRISLQQQQTTLLSYQARALNLEHATTAYAASAQQLKENQHLADEADKQAESIRQSGIGLEQQQTQLSASLANETELQTNLLELNRQLEFTQQREMAEAQLVTVKQALANLKNKGDQLKAEFTLADNNHKQLELHWHQGQAALLAQQLEQGAACPVCGSTEHPGPANTGLAALPTDEQRAQATSLLDALQAKLNDARESYGELNAQSKELKAQISQLAKVLGAQHDGGALTKQLAEKQKQLDDWKQQKIKLGELVKQKAALAEQEKRQADVFIQHKKQWIDSEKEAKSLHTALELARKELPEAYREAGALLKATSETEVALYGQQQLIETTRAQQIEFSKVYEASAASQKAIDKAVVQTRQKSDAAAAKWEQSLLNSTFDNQAEFNSASREDQKTSELAAEIESFTRKQTKLLGSIEQQQTTLQGQTKPNLDQHRVALEGQRQKLVRIESEWQRVNTRLNQLQNADKSIQKLLKLQQKQDQQYKTIGTLSEVANGQTGKKISLQRFVLGVLLDDVLIAASQRLAHMSKGRYRLLRKEDRAKGNKASGLELEVDDAYTGKTRPVATLSGGESFIASLSLALGLSEVVQAYAGGVHLDTLFVDEGFGSLDADSLDDAVRTLMDLRESGRMVGIISHVSELKEQIHQRIDILSGKEGSSIKLVV